MSNTKENDVATARSDKTKSRLAIIKLISLLFFSSLVGLFSLVASAAELTNTVSKTDSGYYDGSYGKGAYWVMPGLYGSMFGVGGKGVTDSNLPDSNTDKSLKSNQEDADKPKRYFIYTYYQLNPAIGSIQNDDDVSRAETKHMRYEFGLPRKTRVKISRIT